MEAYSGFQQRAVDKPVQVITKRTLVSASVRVGVSLVLSVTNATDGVGKVGGGGGKNY